MFISHSVALRNLCIINLSPLLSCSQLTNGELHFRYSCGNAASASLLTPSASVTDGRWHNVLLEVNSTTLKLTLDQHHPASAVLAEPCRLMGSHGALLFASLAQGAAAEVDGHAPNFIGCLEGLKLNREPIRFGDTTEWTGSGSRRVFGVYQCCSRAGACDKNPCQNGGTCEEDASGGKDINR